MGFSDEIYKIVTAARREKVKAMRIVFMTIVIIVFASVPAVALDMSVPGYTVETFATYAETLPRHMTFDGSGNLYVTQLNSGNIWKITPSGAAGQFVSGFIAPYSIDWGGGTAYGDYLYVGQGGAVTRVDLISGNKTFFAGQDCDGSLTIDKTGNYGGYMYVGTGCYDDIKKIDTAGHITTFSTWPGWTDGGAPYGIDFDPGTAYGGLMYVGCAFEQGDAGKSGLFTMNTGGTPTRFCSDLVQVWNVHFDKTGLFAGSLFVIGRASYESYPSIYTVSTDGIATEFATSTILNVHGLAFGPDGALYVSEYSSWDGLVTISRITPAAGELELAKTDNINEGDCVVPDSEINYTITYDFTGPGDTNVLLTDYLPAGVDYNSSTPEGDYNEFDGTVTWNIGTAPADGSGTFSLSCIVNYSAEPCSIITNICELIGDSTDEIAEVNTPVCFWNQIIYVDHNATGLNNGLSWEDAYLDLQDALDRAAVDGNSEIWVAAGTYKPSVQDNSGYKTFKLIDGIPVYGHFAGTETALWQRDLNDPNNKTILSGVGVIAPYVVTASGRSYNNILEGFTILVMGTSGDGIKIEDAYMAVSNCVIIGPGSCGIFAHNSEFTVDDCNIQNNNTGIYDINSSFTVTECIVQNNNNYGLYANFGDNGNLSESLISNSFIYNNNTGVHLHGTSSPVAIENCFIHNNRDGIIVAFSSMPPFVKGCKIISNSEFGIYVSHSPINIFDNWICRNNQRGIYLYYLNSPMEIRNNTIAYNAYGIYRYGGTAPVINSSIVCLNTSSDLGGAAVVYSWVTADGDPLFVDADINDFHIMPFSPCVNAGDPGFNDSNEVDIDGQCRLMIGKTIPRVDIGADEIDWPKADFDRDEIVNFIDFALFAPAWLTTDANISLDEDSDVDIYDLAEFAGYWLWKTPSEE